MTRTGIFLALTRYVAWSRLRRRQVRTLRLLASLPPEIRADIGWPDLYVATDGFVRLPADMALPDTGLPDTGSARRRSSPLASAPRASGSGCAATGSRLEIALAAVRIRCLIAIMWTGRAIADTMVSAGLWQKRPAR